MMDGLEGSPLPVALAAHRRLVLLGGSRMPEALGNLERLLLALDPWARRPPGDRHAAGLLVLAPTGSRPTPEDWQPLLQRLGYEPAAIPDGTGAQAAWCRGSVLLLIGSGGFGRWASWGEVGIAAAGTATEQLVGLGVPCLSLPGPGPQFKLGFAQRQSRLLGGAVGVCRSAAELADRLELLWREPSPRRALGRIGRRRMGPPGGSAALAELVQRHLVDAASAAG
jgi:uncharacterized protein (TIGR03492 family)